MTANGGNRGAANSDVLMRSGPYTLRADGLYMFITRARRRTEIQLTSFPVQIIEEQIEDDEVEKERSYVIRAVVAGVSQRVVVPATEYSSLSWVGEQLGANAWLAPNTKEQIRCGIQRVSGTIRENIVYLHTGWRKTSRGWVYLHAGGGLGANGAVDGIACKLDEALKHYKLPMEELSAEDLKAAIRASLRILDVAPKHIALPILAGVYRAAIMRCDFSLFLVGPTGTLKTALAALAQQHYGPEMDADNLPASWKGTANANEILAFMAKDAVLTVDDFVPKGGNEGKLQNMEADQILRGAGNNQGRQRLNRDITLAPPKPPRGLFLCTGEDTPKGESLQGRLLIIDMRKGDVNLEALTASQGDARQGEFSQAMAGFVRFLATRYDRLRSQHRQARDQFRERASRALASENLQPHSRTPGVVGDLMFGWEVFLEYAKSAGALSDAESDQLLDDGWKALMEAAKRQASERAEEEPCQLFIKLVNSAIASGRAHLADQDGDHPGDGEAYGWRVRLAGQDHDQEIWQPQGNRIGWVKDGETYLELEASLAAAKKLAFETGQPISLSPVAIKKLLKDRGFLSSTDNTRNTLYVRRTFEHAERKVFHLTRDLVPGTMAAPKLKGPSPW